MYYLRILTALIILQNPCKILTDYSTDWTYDLVSLTAVSNTPDVLTVDLEMSRIKRGVFVFGGDIDFKQDMTDELLLGVTVSYSLTGGSDYITTPFHVPTTNLSHIANTFYKDIVMESVADCSDNALWVEDTFEPPLTKRLVHLENCSVSNENMPSKIKSGYYKILIKYTQQAEGYVEFVIKVEPMW